MTTIIFIIILLHYFVLIFLFENEHLQELYRGFLGKPLGKKSHELLHTTYTNRETTF